jgi:hypothetical protein
MSYFPAIEKWIIPKSVITESFKEMARDGKVGNEGIALWLGKRSEGQAQVTHLLALRGSGITRKPAVLMIEPELINSVTDITIELEVALIGQIHSHGPLHGTNLSITDITYGLSVPFYLSVVAPDYAMKKKCDLSSCGIHVFEPRTGYRRLPAWEVTNRIQVIEGTRPPFLTVGEGKNA